VTFSDAKKEFEIRYYVWATSDFQREIEESFPSLHSFKAGSAWNTCQFMQGLSKREQITLAHGLLKRFHPQAIKHLGESCSVEEESLRARRDDFFRIREFYRGMQQLERQGMLAESRGLFEVIRPDALKTFGEPYFNDEKSLRSRLEAAFSSIPVTFEEELAARKQAGEKVKFVSKAKLRRVMTAKFKEAFGTQCFGMESVEEEDEPSFQMRSDGWIISTHFWFGRREGLLNYNHAIATEAAFEQHGEAGPYVGQFGIAGLISLCAWLGICSQTKWEYVSNDEVETACEAAIGQCRRFFDVAPKLLLGLGPAKLTR
jgi:hypothetical protein